LKSLGAEMIHIDIGYPATEDRTYFQFYKDIVNECRNLGLKVHIEYEFLDPTFYHGSEVYNINSKEDIKKIMLKDAKKIVEQLKPDYFTILNEPYTATKYRLPKKVAMNLTPDDWKEFVEYVAKNLDYHPIGAGGYVGGEEKYIIKFMSIPELDYVAFHWYEFSDETFEKLVMLTKLAKKNGKDILISECWLHHDKKNRYADMLPFWAPLDSKYLELVYEFSKKSGAIAFEPFFTMYFFVYKNYSIEDIKKPRTKHFMKYYLKHWITLLK
jgi:hypothetical protein